MDKQTQINKVERELHAAKGRLREQRQKRWINENYKLPAIAPPAELVEAIQQTETQITQYRQQLKELY